MTTVETRGPNNCHEHRKSYECAHRGSIFVTWDQDAVACYDESNHSSFKLLIDGAALAQFFFIVARDALMANEDPTAALFKACEAGSTKGLGI